jgi:hypothetical protein
MKAVLTATLDPDEHAEASEMLALVRHLGLEHMEGDTDGRRWIQVSGFTDEVRLSEIISLLEGTRNLK